MKKGMRRFPGRPYPKDHERRRLVKIELAKRDMTVTALAQAVGIAQPHASSILNGTRRSAQTEIKIAAFFGKKREELFPIRTNGELLDMREAQARQKEGAA